VATRSTRVDDCEHRGTVADAEAWAKTIDFIATSLALMAATSLLA
jgi:hypothetical protein